MTEQSAGQRQGTRVTFLDQTGAKSVDAVIAELRLLQAAGGAE